MTACLEVEVQQLFKPGNSKSHLDTLNHSGPSCCIYAVVEGAVFWLYTGEQLKSKTLHWASGRADGLLSKQAA